MARVCRRQDGAVGIAQLYALGFSTQEVQRLVDGGAFVRELDGSPYHTLPADQERDRVKDVWLQRHCISIVRVTEFRFQHDRAWIEADLRDFLADDRAA